MASLNLNLYENSDDNYDVLPIPTLDKDYSRFVTNEELSNFFKNETKSSCVDFIHVNARSLKKNFVELENLLTRIPNKLSAIAISETCLNESNRDAFLCLAILLFQNAGLIKLVRVLESFYQLNIIIPYVMTYLL